MMKSILILLFCLAGLQLSAQTKDVQTLVSELEKFMDNHIPEGHSSVTGYTLTYSNGILKKRTLVDEEGESHSTSFNMKMAEITADKFKLDGVEAKMLGYKTYYEINIDGAWIIDGLTSKKAAKEVVGILEAIVEAAN